jgi:hypothetical protein
MSVQIDGLVCGLVTRDVYGRSWLSWPDPRENYDDISDLWMKYDEVCTLSL